MTQLFSSKLECHNALYLALYCFLLYINDIVKNIGSNIRLFADDTSHFILVDNPTTTVLCLNSDLEKLSRWTAIWSPSLWQSNTITWSKHCNSCTCSQVYTWHQTFYLIKYHATLGRYIHIYTFTTGFRPSNWSVVSTLIPYPCPNQSDIPSLYNDVIIFFYYYCIYSLCSH